MKDKRLSFRVVIVLMFIVLMSSCKNKQEEIDTVIMSKASQDKYGNAIRLGGEWFLANQDEQFLHYIYDTKTKGHPASTHPLREMGALYAINDLYGYTKDQRYLNLSYKGYAYFSQYFTKSENYLLVNITPDATKLGYNAFMILNIIPINIKDKENELDYLAEGILSMQKDSGEYRTFFFIERETGVDYYPGQSILALMRLYSYDKQEKYIESVKKSLGYYPLRWNQDPSFTFVPWYTKGYYEYYQQTNDDFVREFIFEMNDFLVSGFSADGTCNGPIVNRDISIAAYAESVVKAYKLAKFNNDTYRQECYSRFINNAADIVVDIQIQNTTDVLELGGFPNSLGEIRVDNNQHAVMMLIDAKREGIID
ncbi:MAG: hypothetical protein NDI94_03785 [Candidatus Woesearchaeota archaeon]|nr:hypothetical protein [Candidatus Woesearchaeota archaeon]